MNPNPNMSDVERDLLDALQPDALADTGAPEVRESWQATSLGEADWCARKAQAARRAAARVQAEADRQIAAIREWAEKVTAEDLADAAYFERQAIDWFDRYRQEQLAAGTKPERLVKTLELPGGGKVQARQQQASLKVTDDKAAIEWAKSVNPDFIRVKEELNKNDVKAHLAGLRVTEDGQWVTADGEIVDAPEGVELEPGSIKLSLSLPEVTS